MTTRDLGYAGLEAALNGYLGLDPVTRERLAALHGRTVGVEVLGPGLDPVLHRRRDGGPAGLRPPRGRARLLAARHATRPDARRRPHRRCGPAVRSAYGSRATAASPSGSARSSRTSRSTGRSTSRASSATWWRTRSAARPGRRRTSAGARGRTAEQNLREYLQEEARLLPTRYEVRELLDAVDALRDDVERLAARVERLGKRSGEVGEAQ